MDAFAIYGADSVFTGSELKGGNVSMENTVDLMATQVQDDAAFTAQEPQTLADVIGGNEQQPVAEANAPAEQPPQSEPGWMKKRVGAAVNKAVAEAEARIRAEYESQLAPLREMQMEAEADKLMTEGIVTNREVAMELVRARKGLPPQNTPAATPPAVNQPPRDEQGRFVARNPEPDNASQRRAQMLVTQAENLKAVTGVDVMALYNSDPDVHEKILSGEWDFTDVLKQHNGAARSVPAPVRSANGLAMGSMSISDMTDEQFDRLNDYLARGGKVDARR